MAHTEKRSTPLVEGSIAIVTGAVYGTVHTLSGHPLDNVKARLQLDPSFRSLSATAAARRMWRLEGLSAFFRGCVPPLWGSAVYRGVMMSSYEMAYTHFDRYDASSPWKAEYCGGVVRPCVLASALFCSLCRSLVEAPIEQSKVMRQTGRPWQWGSLYRGLGAQTARTTAILMVIFVPYDAARRKTSLFSHLLGQFALVSGVCAFAYGAVWPLETLKNCAQAGLPTPHATLAERLKYVGGLRGLYLGAGPGVLCGGLRNGCAMLAMNGIANPLATRLGLREEKAA